ncbi:MAG: ribosomal L7Ae/L30e/S12e/Gadd45 family protein [Firmicutes bacterium]|nr:ribosomal L7Ae/L30e/S12e/Gadd45 family protein [Bacillota bacterium]
MNPNPDKINRYLGLARRAGRIIPGYRSCVNAVKAGKIHFMIVAEDVSENTKDKFSSLCKNRRVPMAVFGTVDTLSAAAGYRGIGIYGITDKNFADAMKKEIEMDR